MSDTEHHVTITFPDEEAEDAARIADVYVDGQPASWDTAMDDGPGQGVPGPQGPDDLDRDELEMIYESLEVTIQSLDRPEPGTEERLAALMDKVTRILVTTSHQRTLHAHRHYGTVVKHTHLGGHRPHGMWCHDQDYPTSPTTPGESYEVLS